MRHQVLATTVENRPIEMFSYEVNLDYKARVLLKAGIHGDEPEGVQLLDRFLREEFYEQVITPTALWIIPRVNPDGVFHQRRVNASGVDLNRNFPSSDWVKEMRAERYFPGPFPGSELETQTLCKVVDHIRPTLIVSLHNYEKPMVNVNGECGIAADVLAQKTGYPITQDMGYETPGSFGRWAWEKYRAPTITLEIKDYVGIDSIWPQFGNALLEAINAHSRSLH